jgi:hypothetical protein
MAPLQHHGVTGTSTEQAVAAYVDAWNESDPRERRKLVEACWAEQGTLTTKHRQFVGRDALLAAMADFRRRCPHDRAVLTGAVDQQDRYFRICGRLERPDGTSYGEVTDFGELGPNGRIVSIVTFAR